ARAPRLLSHASNQLPAPAARNPLSSHPPRRLSRHSRRCPAQRMAGGLARFAASFRLSISQDESKPETWRIKKVRHISKVPRTLTGVRVAVMAGCTTEPTALALDDALSAVRGPGGPRWSSNAAVHWNEIARDMVATTMASTPFAIRGYAIMSVAQYHAAITA